MNAHCYWLLRREGMSPREATREIEGRTVAFKNELLFSRILISMIAQLAESREWAYTTPPEKRGYNPGEG